MTLEIFPYIFSRYASLEVNMFNQMKLKDGDKYFSNWIELVKNKEYCTEMLCNLIFQLINKEQNEAQRKVLLNLKRAIYNNRNTITHLTQKLHPNLYETIANHLSAYYEHQSKLSDFLQNLEYIYNQYITSHRSTIKSLISSYPFQNGVLLSSKALYQELEKFSKISATAIDKREWRTEFSILRYLTRMTYKTSPFSTLTFLGLTMLSDDNGKDIIQPQGIIQSNIRLNNKLLKRIKGLMESHGELNSLMYVSLNSSVRNQKNKLDYLLNSANIETFQRIETTPIINFIYNLLLSNDNQEMTLKDLCEKLADQVATTPKEIKNFLLKLVDAGLLELTIRCSEIMPDWECKLLDFLSPHIQSNTAAKLLFDIITELYEIKVQFTHSDINNRNILLGRIARNIDNAFLILEEQAGLIKYTPKEIKLLTEKIIEKYQNGTGFEKLPYIPFDYRQESIFYEDTFIREIGSMPREEINSITKKLHQLCSRLTEFDRRRPNREKMRLFFKENYDTCDAIPIIDFYQAYYKNKQKLIREGLSETGLNEIQNSESSRQIAFEKILANCVQDEKGVHLTDKDLAVFPLSKTGLKAASVFIQFFRAHDNTNIQGVINNLMPGMGKINGRFLHLFDEKITAKQKATNLSLLPDTIMMELNDDSSFNANIHPPLLNHEIKMPASNTLMERSHQIDINRISVAYHTNDDRLMLSDRDTGKEICAFDLCLETLSNRSNLYQMLSHFNPIPHLSYSPIINTIDQYFKKDNIDGIRTNPRITYEKDVVLRRKGWIVEKYSIPEKQINETDSIYYLKLKQWLQVHQMPQDVFIFLKSSYLPKSDTNKDLTTRDDYKPQYISFNQPLLIKLFQRLIQKAGAHIYMEEVLPSVESTGNLSYRVSEHLLQWYEK